MNFDNIGLSYDTLEWYKTEGSDIKSAMEIGKNIVTSTNYQMDQNDLVSNLQEKISELKKTKENLIVKHKEELRIQDDKLNEMLHEKDRNYKELENRQNTNNEMAIKIAVEQKTELIGRHQYSLEEDKKRLQLNLDQKERQLLQSQEDYNNLKTHLCVSKNKGEFTEKEIEEFLELEGYQVSKRGNKAGDRHVYYNGD